MDLHFHKLIVTKEVIGNDFFATLEKTLILRFQPYRGLEIVWNDMDNKKVKIVLDNSFWYDYSVNSFFLICREYCSQFTLEDKREELNKLISDKIWDRITYE